MAVWFRLSTTDSLENVASVQIVWLVDEGVGEVVDEVLWPSGGEGLGTDEVDENEKDDETDEDEEGSYAQEPSRFWFPNST